MNFNNILFLDIETVSQYETYNHLPDDWKELWDLKAGIINRNKEEETSESAYPRASIYAEFGKIVCISCGYLQGSVEDKKLVLKSFCGHDEKKLLAEFADMLQKWSSDSEKYLCAHNGKEFDYPYLCRRMIINGIEIPEALKYQEENHGKFVLDTMELWKFGDYKNYISLHLLANVLSVPTSKTDIDGSMVQHVYYKEKNLPRIVEYCQRDVVVVGNVVLRFKNKALLSEEDIVVVK